MKNVFFPHDDFIIRRDIKRTFKTPHNEEDSIKEKLVNLYILEAILIPKQQHNHTNLQHLDIVDHGETFKDYPWERLSYILTYQFFKKASYSNKNVVYLQGFPPTSLLGF